MAVLKNRWILIIMGSLVVAALVLLTVLLVLRETSAVDQTSETPVELLQRYIRINTTTGNDFTPALEFWQCLADDAGVKMNVYYYAEGLPVIVLKWPGSVPTARTIMLNSHMDVVPADEDEGWTYPPFEGVLADDGKIYGRGTQDMKSVSIQYYLALKDLIANETLLRTVYMTLMPDEEVGGYDGVIPFLQSEEFAALNVGFELDEGSSYDLPAVALFYQDKVVWQIQVDCYGEATHGSTFAEANTTATGKCFNVMTRMFEFREEQYEISLTTTIFNAGKYTGANLNRMSAGGTANNIVPSVVTLVYDIRLSTTVNEDTFEAQLRQIISESGTDIELTFIIKDQQSPATVVSDANPYWVAVANAASELNLMVLPVVPPGSTDARHVRSAGIPAFGLSPMPNTPMLLHAVNEYIDKDIFLQGIEIYKPIIRNLANIPAEQTSSDPSVYLAVTTDA